MPATTTSRIDRIRRQIADLNERRSELRAQLYRIAGATANADREIQLMHVERQLTSMYMLLAELEGE